MEKALQEEHIRYGEARFRDKELVRPFVNRIYQDLEVDMKPKTCEGCIDEIISSNRCEFCIRTHPQDFYVAKDK